MSIICLGFYTSLPLPLDWKSISIRTFFFCTAKDDRQNGWRNTNGSGLQMGIYQTSRYAVRTTIGTQRSWLISGTRKSWQRSTKVALIAAHSRLNWWNVDSTTILSLNKGGGMPPTSCGNSLPKEGTSARKNHLIWCNVFSINLCATHFNNLVPYGFSWGVVFYGLYGAN